MNQADKYQDFANRVNKLNQRLSKIARKRGVTCFRLYDLDMPEFPFLIDIYEGHLYVAEYERNHTLSESDHNLWLKGAMVTLGETLGMPLENIHLKVRKSVKTRTEQYTKLDDAKTEMTVQEHDLKFIINLDDYLDTGLFLDHRPTRKMVMEQAKDKNILNLFAYTGSFTVYAAAGGANQVMTMDLSNRYIDWSKRNMALNGFVDNTKYHFVVGDVLQNLSLLKPRNYDIIVLDPPSFSNSAKMQSTFDIQRDHWWLINKCLPLLKRDGVIYFSTNLTRFKMYENKLDAKSVKDITNQTKDFDFERKLRRQCFTIS